MKKIILEKLIYKNYLKTALTSIFFIEIILIFVYFNASSNIVNKSIEFLFDEIKYSVNERVIDTILNIEHKFEDVENLLYLIKNEQENFFKYEKNININNTLDLKYAKNGIYYKANNNGGSSVVVPKNTKISKELKEKIIKTELFDSSLKTIVDKHEIVLAAYFNSYDNMNRYYPFLEESYNIFPINFDIKEFNFYYEADKKHNPSKDVVWTDVYLDPSSKGWMISAIVPIYNKEFLEGVTGIDIPIDSLIKYFLNSKLPYEGSSFLVNENGNFLAGTKKIENILKLNEKQYYVNNHNEKISETILKKYSFNVKDMKAIDFESLSNSNIYSSKIKVNGVNYLLISHKFNRTNWYIISLIDERKVALKVNELENYYKEIGYLIIVFIISFYIVFFIYLYVKAREFVQTLNKPLQEIVEFTKNLGIKKEIKKLESCGIEEIDILNDNFNKLSKDLNERTKKLIETEKIKEYHQKLANTDSLTNVFNRHFLNDFANEYMKIIKREKETLSLLILDIDNFKTINDTYGHNIGDEILKNLVKRINKIIRENDLVVRYGGDEFIILLPNTKLEAGKNVAKKLIDSINRTNQLQKTMLSFTISIGVSEYKKTDKKIEDIIKRADKALYEAKNRGKNQLI